MSGAVTAGLITLALAFVAGLAAGIAFVIAASVRRAEKGYRRNRQVEESPFYRSDVRPDDEGPDDEGPDDLPRWPTHGGY